MPTIQHIVLVGAGNVGAQLGRAFHAAGLTVDQVFSRTIEKARPLANALNARYCTKIQEVGRGADLYLLAVRDDAIEEVARGLAGALPAGALVAHTSGAKPSMAVGAFMPRCGVFYPLQTLRLEQPADFEGLPVCVYAPRPEDQEALLELAGRISRAVYRVDDEDRAQLHVAAVFANNFSNHLFHIARALLAERDLPFDLLRPLLAETFEKVRHRLPEDVQTGPARRGDQSTQDLHLALLRQHPHWRQLYRLLSEDIARTSGQGIHK